jgi:hypothetical protein
MLAKQVPVLHVNDGALTLFILILTLLPLPEAEPTLHVALYSKNL